MRLGVLGGTFDPVHCGHLAAAAAAREQLSLERVLFVPAGDPWLKAGAAITDGSHRLAMVELAIAGDDGYAASRIELDRPGPTYTAETLAELQSAYGPETELYFILGADALRDFGRWHDPAGVLARCTLAALTRPDQGPLELGGLDAVAPGAAARAVAVEVASAVSATEVRRRAAAGEPLAGLAPPAVERYILAHGLYKERA